MVKYARERLLKRTVNQQHSGRNMSQVYFLDVLNILKGPIQRMEVEKREKNNCDGATGKTFSLLGREAIQESVISIPLFISWY